MLSILASFDTALVVCRPVQLEIEDPEMLGTMPDAVCRKILKNLANQHPHQATDEARTNLHNKTS
jgi:hypothetical protein